MLSQPATGVTNLINHVVIHCSPAKDAQNLCQMSGGQQGCSPSCIAAAGSPRHLHCCC